MTVETILRDKGGHVATIRPDARVEEAVTKLATEDVGALVVSRNGRDVEGVISERDIARGLAQHGRDVVDRSVSQLMTGQVITCVSGDRVAGIMALMTEHRIRHVPVTKDGELCGIVSIGDVVKTRLDEVMSEADAMLAYIRS